MKKRFAVGLVSLGMLSTNVFGGETYDELYETSRHNIRITCTLDEDNCTYQSWNKPRQVGQGKPDFEIRDGEQYGPVSDPDRACDKGAFGYHFILKEVRIDFAPFSGCREKGQPHNAKGKMTIYIHGKQKDHYWLYEK